mgnify:CR=1 FL=1
MTYDEYIDQFPTCDYFDNIDTKGKEKHHIIPVASQCNEYNKLNNTSYTPLEFRRTDYCSNLCKIVEAKDHFKCHYLYAKEHPEDQESLIAFALMYKLGRKSEDNGIFLEMTPEELEDASNFYVECKKAAVEKMTTTCRTSNFRKRRSDSQKEFYKTENDKFLKKC